MSSTLESLIRVHRWQLDEQRRNVAEIESLIAKLRADLEHLEVERETEQRIAATSAEASFAYAAYAAALIERRRKLTLSLVEAEQQAAKAREALADVFQEVKRYEIAAARRLLNQRAEAERLQQNDMDEIAIGVHRLTSSTGMK